MESITTYLMNVATDVLPIILQLICVIIGVFLIGVAKNLLSKTKLNYKDAIMEHVKEDIETIVIATNQTIVDKLKKDHETLTDDEKEKVFNLVKDNVLSLLTSDQIQAITDKYGSLDGVDALIEKAVSINHK